MADDGYLLDCQKKQIELRKMVSELLEAESGLRKSEIPFLDKMHVVWDGDYTEKQSKWIEDIWERIFG